MDRREVVSLNRKGEKGTEGELKGGRGEVRREGHREGIEEDRRG